MTRISSTELFERFEAEEDRQHFEVLNEESMSVELGRDATGTAEPKNPPRGDEIYYVIPGSGMARAGDETYQVEAGDVAYVESGLEHDFFDIEEAIIVRIVLAEKAEPGAYTIREGPVE